jgi:hypothetical protein
LAEARAADAEQVAARAGADQEVEDLPRREPHAQPRQAAQRRQAIGRDSDPPRDRVDDLPLLARLAGRRHHRLGQLDERLREEAQERERHVLALVERRGGEDVVGVAVGLVDV